MSAKLTTARKRTTLQNKMRRLGIGKGTIRRTVEKVLFALCAQSVGHGRSERENMLQRGIAGCSHRLRVGRASVVSS
jgi:hypothetical protein